MELPAGISSIFLVGVKHSGKSHVARLLGEETGLAVIDADREVEKTFGHETETSLTVRQINGMDDGITFRRLESQVCREAATRSAVVATGGGICDNPDAVASMHSGVVVALIADARVLFERIMRHGIPTFIKAQNRDEAWDEFSRICERRTGRYRDLADIIVDTNGLSAPETAAKTLHLLEAYSNGRK